MHRRMPLYDAVVPQTIKMLKNLEQWLEKASAHAEAKGFDVATLLGARLAPDQYPLLKQIQAACDAAKFAAARVAGTLFSIAPEVLLGQGPAEASGHGADLGGDPRAHQIRARLPPGLQTRGLRGCG